MLVAPNPYNASYQSFYENSSDFGSAESRVGNQFGLIFTPF
ncbi:MAG: hypothetical protein ACI9ZX_001763 [Algoriphagus sp.]|jgi:hypothetical protein